MSVDKIVRALQTKGSVFSKLTMIVIAIMFFVYFSLRLIEDKSIITALVTATLIIVVVIINWLIDFATKHPEKAILESNLYIKHEEIMQSSKNNETIKDTQQIEDTPIEEEEEEKEVEKELEKEVEKDEKKVEIVGIDDNKKENKEEKEVKNG